MNYLFRVASESGADVFGCQHNDVEAPGDSAKRYIDFLNGLFCSKRNWASVFTSYDILSAYRVEAVRTIGLWDTSFPNPNYHIDVDWFHRARLNKYELVNSGIRVIHHGGSSTVNSDPALQRIAKAKRGMNLAYYRRKWGGKPRHELFRRPWNAEDEVPAKARS